MKRWKIDHVETAGFGAHNSHHPSMATKSTAAAVTVTRDKQFLVFLFCNISEVNFLHAKWRFWFYTYQAIWPDVVKSAIHVVPLLPSF